MPSLSKREKKVCDLWRQAAVRAAQTCKCTAAVQMQYTYVVMQMHCSPADAM